MDHMCVRGLKNLSKWGFLYGKKLRFYERYDHGKQHEGVDFDDFILLRPNKWVIEDKDLGMQLKGTLILLRLENAILDLIKVPDV